MFVLQISNKEVYFLWQGGNRLFWSYKADTNAHWEVRSTRKTSMEFPFSHVHFGKKLVFNSHFGCDWTFHFHMHQSNNTGTAVWTNFPGWRHASRPSYLLYTYHMQWNDLTTLEMLTMFLYVSVLSTALIAHWMWPVCIVLCLEACEMNSTHAHTHSHTPTHTHPHSMETNW